MPVVHDSIRTNSNLDVYPTHEAKLGKGGYRTVANIAERDNITYERCEEGMLVTVLEDDTNNNKTTTYILKQNTRDSRTWEKFNNGAVDANLTNRVTALETSSAKVDNEIATLNGEISTKVSLDEHNNLVASLSTYALKSDLNTLATKDELNDKADRSELDTKANSSDLQNLATKEKVNEINSTLTNAINTKANQATTYTKTEVDDLVNAKANANATVNLTGDQSIAGAKTFSSPVVVPDATETIHAVNLAQLNTKANWNAIVNLTDDQTIAGAKTFTSNITAPNITAMQNSINTLDGKVTNIESDVSNIENTISQVISSNVTPIGVYKKVENKTIGAKGDFKTIQEAFIYVQTHQKQSVNQQLTLTLLEDLNNPTLYFRGAWYPYLTIDCNGFILANKLTIDLSSFSIKKLKLNGRMVAASSFLWISGNINIQYTNSDYPGGCITALTNALIYVNCQSCNFSAPSNKSAFYSYGNSMIYVKGSSGNSITQTSGAYCFAVNEGGKIQTNDGLNLNGVTVPKANIAANTITRQGIIFGNYTL